MTTIPYLLRRILGITSPSRAFTPLPATVCEACRLRYLHGGERRSREPGCKDCLAAEIMES